MRFDLVAAIDACYAPLLDDRGWLAGILAALAPIDQGLGRFAHLLRIDPALGRTIELAVDASSGWGARTTQDEGGSAPALPSEFYTARQPVASLARFAARAGRTEEIQRLLQRVGVGDVLAVSCDEPGGGRILVGMNVAPGGHHAPRTVHQLARFVSHLSAAARLRHALRCALGPTEGAPFLADGVRRLDRPAGPLHRSDPGEALEVWRGLVAGTWSLVDRVDRDGLRRILARRNPPGLPDPKALTEPERSVSAMAALGQQNKLIAWALGISPSAVAAHLHTAEQKLKLGSRAELVHLLAALVRPAPP